MMLATTDKDQADRCRKASITVATITETFGSVEVVGKVQSVIDNNASSPKSWSVIFKDATTRAR